MGVDTAQSAAFTGTLGALNASMEFTLRDAAGFTVCVPAASSASGIVLTFEASVPGTANWVALGSVVTNSTSVITRLATTAALSAASPFGWFVARMGFTKFRVRASSWVAGSVTVVVVPSDQLLS